MGQDVQYNGQTWKTMHLVGPDNVDTVAGLDDFSKNKLKSMWSLDPTLTTDFPLWVLYQVKADPVSKVVSMSSQLVVRPSGVYASSPGGSVVQGVRLADSTALLPLLKD